MDSPLSEPIFAGRMKLQSRRNGFKFCDILWFTFSLFSKCSIQIRKLGCPNQSRVQKHLTTDNPNVNLGVVDWSIWAHRYALNDEY